MKLSRIFDFKTVIIILLAAIILGLIASVILSLAERIIFPENYKDIVYKYAQKYAVPPELVFAVIKAESGFDKNAQSRVGAQGLMQLMPSTAEWLAEEHLNDNPHLISLYDPETNIKYGTYYLQYLFSRFGSWEKAIIAYNWREGNFAKFIEESGYTEGEYNSIPVSETRNYVKKVTQYWEKYKELYK